jgi:mannose-6-phosphate isomerase
VLETKGDADALREVFLGLFGSAEKRAIAEEVTAGAAALRDAGFVDEAEWTSRLAREYPGDVGVAVALLLNLVRLSPGQALFLDAGNLHAYLEGTGIELMASSDNVLRGGLTVKHVDVPGLAEVLDFRPTDVPYARRVATPDGAIVYRTAAAEFSLSRASVQGERVLAAARGPQIVLVTRGECAVRRGGEVVHVRRGESLYVRHGDAPLELHGDATVFRATVP